MKRRQKKAVKLARPVTAAARPPATPGMSVSAARRIGLALLWLATIAGVGYGLYRLEPYAHAASSGAVRLEWTKVPLYVPNETLKSIDAGESGCDYRPLLASGLDTPDLCGKLARELAKSPWIAKVDRVTKRSDGLVSVQATFRHYLTCVIKDGMGYSVDEKGVRLPGEMAAKSLPDGMVAVEGERAGVPELGKPWQGDDVQAGLKLVTYLYEHCPAPLLASLKAVDVSNYKLRANRRDGELQIRTVLPHTRINWGVPPGEEYDIEATASRKLLMYLWTIFTKENQLPDHTAIDLRPRDAALMPPAP